MATMIGKECLDCGFCEAECPTGAVFEGAEAFVIDPSSCTEAASLVLGPRPRAFRVSDCVARL